MAETLSNMIPLGTVAPEFQLPDVVTADLVSLHDIKGEKGTVVMFICNHCPFVKHVIDEVVRVAWEYKAACTPDFYLFDPDLKLVYRGQLDNSRPGNGIPLNGRDLREALDALFNNRQVPGPQRPSLGCGIKWKYQGPSGN